MSRMRKIRLLLTLLLLVLSLCLLVWGFMPPGTESTVVPLQPDALQLPTPTGWLHIAAYVS